MTPRPYRMERRRELAEETRSRIVNAARQLLASSGGFAEFSVDAIARRAGVARMTVYYQFGSKEGLLEGLCDSLAIAGGMAQMADAFRQPDPLDALDRFITVLMGFWSSDRAVLRGLGGLAMLDPDFAAVLEGRSGRRREGLKVLLGRTAQRYGQPTPEAFEETVDVLYTLTSFTTFDTLAGEKRSPDEVGPLVRRLARLAVMPK
jgi:AcrR family transcriptional regulator